MTWFQGMMDHIENSRVRPCCKEDTPMQGQRQRGCGATGQSLKELRPLYGYSTGRTETCKTLHRS